MSAIPADVHARPLPAVTIGEAAARIHRWWRATREGLHLGFAARSVLAKVIEEGAGASHTFDPRVAPWVATNCNFSHDSASI